MSNKVFIIGNGFDLDLGLNTRYYQDINIYTRLLIHITSHIIFNMICWKLMRWCSLGIL